MDLLTAAADLLVGARCSGCGVPSRSLCPSCSDALRPSPALVRHRPCAVVAAGAYDGPLRGAIVAWKERGRLTLERPLAHLLAAAIAGLDLAQPVTLVPVPSRPDRRRVRGADVVRDLADASARLLAEAGAEVSVTSALRTTGQVRDQAGLSADERARNVSGAFALRRVPVRPVVVVDDVITTGASLREAVRVLRAHGADVAGAAVIANRESLAYGPSQV